MAFCLERRSVNFYRSSLDSGNIPQNVRRINNKIPKERNAGALHNRSDSRAARSRDPSSQGFSPLSMPLQVATVCLPKINRRRFPMCRRFCYSGIAF